MSAAGVLGPKLATSVVAGSALLCQFAGVARFPSLVLVKPTVAAHACVLYAAATSAAQVLNRTRTGALRLNELRTNELRANLEDLKRSMTSPVSGACGRRFRRERLFARRHKARD
jgi:hypothetical protein